MPVSRGGERQDNDDLVEFIRHGSHRVGQAIEVPSPQGRSSAGWVLVQFKVPQEQIVMFDQLREHPFFRGVWKTSAQVAWSVTYLGLQALTKFIDTGDGQQWSGWQRYKSNFLVLAAANEEWNKVRKQEALVKAASKLKRTIHDWLDKGTAYGKYAAFKCLLQAVAARDVAEDVREYDEEMFKPERGTQVALVFDDRASQLWRRVVPAAMGDVDGLALDSINVELCQPYYDELDAAGKGHDDDAIE